MISDDDDDFLIRSRVPRTPTSTGGSWWLALSRERFAAEIAIRFAANKAETDTPGLATWTKAPRPNEAA
jgi:hypothetical protein